MAVTRLLGRTLLAAIAVVGSTLTPAAAAAPENRVPAVAHAPEPVTILHMGVAGARGPAGYRTALLRCDPAGGTHSSADAACRSLSDAGGYFADLRTGSENTLCPLIYRPVTVRASGMWKNRSIDYEQTYPNACVMRAYTGKVFNF